MAEKNRGGRPEGSGSCGGRNGPTLRSRCSLELFQRCESSWKGLSSSMGLWLREAAEEKLAREKRRAIRADVPRPRT